jgi:hypothetical protein
VAVVVMAGSLSVFGWLAYRGWDAAGVYVAGTLRDRLAGATVESSVSPEAAAQWSQLACRAMTALVGAVVGIALLPWCRRDAAVGAEPLNAQRRDDARPAA